MTTSLATRTSSWSIALAYWARTAILLGAAACSSEGPATSVGMADATLDVSFRALPDSSADAPPEIAAEIDTSTPCPGGIGCACTSDDQCPLTSACVPTRAGKVCIAPCSNGECQGGFVCGTWTKANGNTLSPVCLAKWVPACDPCLSSANCSDPQDSNARCAAPDGTGSGGWFCAPGCSADSDCPPDFACSDAVLREGGSAKQCLPKSQVCGCTPLAIAAAKQTTCMATVGSATSPTCAGTRTCATAVLGPCQPGTPQAEVCNGLDDDCDGTVDNPMNSNGVPTAAACNDSNACTSDVCDPKVGCVHPLATGPCDDGDVCTKADTCSGGACKGQAVGCDDKNPCTDDSCDPSQGCLYAGNSALCDDGKLCTGPDQCQGGGCQGPFNSEPCTDGEVCTEQDTCSGGTCEGTVKACSDGNPCTADSCIDTIGCQHLPLASVCDDGNVCTSGDSCTGGACTGQAVTCDDGVYCTVDVCAPAIGCTYAPSQESVCAAGSLPAFAAMTCGDPSSSAWLLTTDGTSSTPPSGWVHWKLDGTQPDGSPAGTTCQLNVNNGNGLQCGIGQSEVYAMATSPEIDSTTLAPGSDLLLRFESTGSWPATDMAEVYVSADGLTWTLLSKVPASATWGKVQLSLGSWAGKKFKVQLRFSGPCGGSGAGWFVRKVGVFEDLCSKPNTGCSPNAVCSMGDKGLVACTCTAGYTGDGSQCSDLNECQLGTFECDPNASCVNSAGSYSCECNGGWAGDGKLCSDIDECKAGTAICDPNAGCSNTQGSYACACLAGYLGDGKSCQDIDECANGTAKCDPNASCGNTPGGYACTCKLPYVGDGATCFGKKTIQFDPSGGTQSFVVPSGVVALDSVEVAGAGGGGGGNDCQGGAGGGAGGKMLAGGIAVKAGQSLTIVVGSGGGGGTGCSAGGGQGPGAYLGGAGGGAAGPAGCSGGGGGGGGMTGVFLGDISANNALVVAGGGGGGGGGGCSTGGAGGGPGCSGGGAGFASGGGGGNKSGDGGGGGGGGGGWASGGGGGTAGCDCGGSGGNGGTCFAKDGFGGVGTAGAGGGGGGAQGGGGGGWVKITYYGP